MKTTCALLLILASLAYAHRAESPATVLAAPTAENAKRAKAPLHAAVAANDVEEVRRLLAEGADVNARWKNRIGESFTPLLCAAAAGNTEMVALLLDHGADPYAEGGHDTPGPALYQAAGYGRLEVINLLLDRGIDIQRGNSCGWTPLHAAAYYLHPEAVRLLLKRGADINAQSEDGWPAMHMALWFGERSGSKEVIQAMLEAGADINMRIGYGITLLHWAVRFPQEGIVQFLLDNGADVNALDDGGETPIQRAQESTLTTDEDKEEIIRILKNNGGK